MSSRNITGGPTYRSLRACVEDLDKNNHLVRIQAEVDPYLEMAEIHRRVHQAGGPAILYEHVKGSPFQAVSNLYGTLDRSRFIFRKTLNNVKRMIALRADPAELLKSPFSMLGVPFAALKALPRKTGRPVVTRNTTRIDALPGIHSWPEDGGPFITLPQVYSEDPARPGIMTSNLGMYRAQLWGNRYRKNEQIGLHYQIHRGIGVHHTRALEKGEKLRVSIFVGGPPAHSFAAVMPLPEGLPEVAFAGALAGRRFRYKYHQGYMVSGDADFCIVGTIENETLPEGPFGDHLGYYSLQHNFPVLKVEAVYHRPNPIWPFTVVGRPPQEDTFFGALIHELTGPMVPASLPGVKTIHAVDVAGVHPLLLAIGGERYIPYEKRKPREILTIANAILGFGQASLAKYLLIAAEQDDPDLDLHDIKKFLMHVLVRVDWKRDLHFQTSTTMDTLDYSGTGLNEGSRVVIAAAGEAQRELGQEIPSDLKLPPGYQNPRLALPGVLLIQGPACTDQGAGRKQMEALEEELGLPSVERFEKLPLLVVVDDSEFCARHINNFLWVCFTRSNPAADIYGIGSFTEQKHWGCRGSLLIDARSKPHHAPPLVEDPEITGRVDALGAKGGPLEGII